jgi:hypothetical protein
VDEGSSCDLVKTVLAKDSRFLRAVVLLSCSLSKEEAGTLMEGLCNVAVKRAKALVAEQLQQPSWVRRSRLSEAFGPDVEAETRVRNLDHALPSGLRALLLRRLPTYLRPPDTSVPPRVIPPPPAAQAWAQRLAKECMG